jgi:membrane protein DedA with SNARE-associated domain
VDSWIALATAFIVAHSAWAAPVVFLLAFGESLVLIGMLIPATVLMLAIGGMIGSGLLQPFPVFGAAVVGAVAGDWVSFLIGQRVGRSAFRRWPLNRSRSAAAKARLLFRRYGFLSILFGRFLGPVRATVPLVAGILRMRPRTFQVANVASAILWVPGLLAPGYLATRSLDSVPAATPERLVVLGLVTVLFVVLGALAGATILGGRKQRRARSPAV